jgi:hypothetical protein
MVVGVFQEPRHSLALRSVLELATIRTMVNLGIKCALRGQDGLPDVAASGKALLIDVEVVFQQRMAVDDGRDLRFLNDAQEQMQQ